MMSTSPMGPASVNLSFGDGTAKKSEVDPGNWTGG